MDRKLRVLMITDHPLSFSGVGLQGRYIMEALLKTGKYQIVFLGGAIRHTDMRPQRFEEYGDDLIVYPVEGYGNPDIVRGVVRTHKIDVVFFITDPRFFYWLWQMENEIRPLCPFFYYHVWDNHPLPHFNRVLYESTDVIATISKLTSNIVKNVAPKVEEMYFPHAVDTNVFKKYPEETLAKFKQDNFSKDRDKTVFFWNNRNARRKQSGTLLWWFKEFLDIVGHDKAKLIMHTDPKDENGQDLLAMIKELGIDKTKSVLISNEKIQPLNLATLYNCVDCVINISDAEGFGLGTLEALACETPIIVNMTGGLQEQVTDYTNVEISEEFMMKRNKEKERVTIYEHGIGIEPSSKAIIGSQPVPFIFEDRLNRDDFIQALMTFHKLSKEQKQAMGKRGREHVMKNYNFDTFNKRWDDVIMGVHNKYGSWDTRKNYKSWEMREV